MNRPRTQPGKHTASMGEHSEFEVAVYARHIEVTERYTDTQVQRFIRELRRLGVECELVFKSPCG